MHSVDGSETPVKENIPVERTAVRWALYEAEVQTYAQRIILVVLADNIDPHTDDLTISNGELATLCGMRENFVREQLKALCELELICRRYNFREDGSQTLSDTLVVWR